MRRSLWAVVTLASALASPLAAAAKKPPAVAVGAASQIGPLIALALGALLILVVAMLVARAAALPRQSKPSRKSFEGGRALARAASVSSVEEAVERLRSKGAPGSFVSSALTQNGVAVTIRRSKRVPCAMTQGYLTGLFESAWASDVALWHPSCSGKSKDAVCSYEVRRLNRFSSPTEEAWTPESRAVPGSSQPVLRGGARKSSPAPRQGSP